MMSMRCQSIGRHARLQDGMQLLRPRCHTRLPSQQHLNRCKVARASLGKQPDVEALARQTRQSHTGLGAVASTSTPEAPIEIADALVTTPWYQKLGLPILKFAAALALVAALAFVPSGAALAARSGGRAGGSSFGAARSAASSMGSSLGSSSSWGGSSPGSRGAGTLSRGAGFGMGTSSTLSIFGPSYGYGVPVQSSGGGGVGTIVLLGVLAALAFAFLPNILSGSSSSSSSSSAGGDRVSVGKIQVGLLGSARQLQRDLERMTRRANTDSPEGLHYLLQETVLALNRNPDYWVYGRGELNSRRGLDAGEDLFNNISMQERSKFKEETLSNVSGRSSSQRMRRSAPSSSSINELIVVTIIVAAQGALKIPNITNQEEMSTSLNSLGALRSDQVMAVEVLWTPQDDDDYYTKDEMFADYPLLNNL